MRLTGESLQSPALARLVERYRRRLETVDPTFSWSNPEWWRDEVNAVVLVREAEMPSPRGFLIVGYGPHVDDDVRGEICEVFNEGSPLSLLPLIREALEWLTPPWGFQVLRRDERTGRLFERCLERAGLEWTSSPARDGTTEVIRYRIHS